MLKKLFKYDMIYIARVMKIVYAVALAISVIFGVLIALSAKFEWLGVLAVLAALPFILAIAAISVSGFIAVAMRISKNLYSDQGYLTFTLPVKASDILMGKILSGALWELLGVIMAGICVAIPSVLALAAYKIPTEVIEYFADYVIFTTMRGLDGVTSVLFCVLTVLTLVANFVFQPICILTAFSVGQSARASRVGSSIVAYFGINFALSLISSIIQSVVVAISGSSQAQLDASMLGSLNVLNLGVSLIINIAFIVGAYVYVKNVVENKLNLI